MSATPDTTEKASPTSAQNGSRRVQAVDRALDVLDCLGAAGRPLGVSDVARRTGHSKATVHHVLTTLMTRRYVMQDPYTSLYRLGWALYELGSSVVRDVEFTRAARPFLDGLAAKTGESVLLGILDDDAVLYLDRGEAPAGLRMVANAGRRGPLHATASGKVLLAFTSDAGLVERILNNPLQKLTPATITDPAILRRQLVTVRTQGYAICKQEREVGLCSIAVPLRNYTGMVVGSLALAGTVQQMNKASIPSYLADLLEAAHQIEVHIGGIRPSADTGFETIPDA
ncbi:IclR family transcriptional regulator [Nocardioides astragali]|nr:IclR family transcriptional regulator [Nocardioides astragali]